MKHLLSTVAGLVLVAQMAPAPLAAQQAAYPARAVKLVVAFAPGGNNDVPMRIVASRLGELWGVPASVENKPGAGGAMGSDFVARAAPDGYTLLNCNSATHGVGPALKKSLPYDPVRDFSAISLVGSAPNVLLVPSASPIRSLQEFLTTSRAGNGKLAVATAGIGSTQHFSLELLKVMSGVDLIHVPYKGGAPALADLIGGQVPAAITGLPTALQAIKAGKVRALAVTSAERSRHVPDLPTFAEAGLTGYEVTTWTGLCAPAGTSRSIVDKLSEDVRRVVAMPEVSGQLMDAGIEPVTTSPDRLAKHIAGEVAKFSRIVATAGLVIE